MCKSRSVICLSILVFIHNRLEHFYLKAKTIWLSGAFFARRGWFCVPHQKWIGGNGRMLNSRQDTWGIREDRICFVEIKRSQQRISVSKIFAACTARLSVLATRNGTPKASQPCIFCVLSPLQHLGAIFSRFTRIVFARPASKRACLSTFTMRKLVFSNVSVAARADILLKAVLREGYV